MTIRSAAILWIGSLYSFPMPSLVTCAITFWTDSPEASIRHNPGLLYSVKAHVLFQEKKAAPTGRIPPAAKSKEYWVSCGRPTQQTALGHGLVQLKWTLNCSAILFCDPIRHPVLPVVWCRFWLAVSLPSPGPLGLTCRPWCELLQKSLWQTLFPPCRHSATIPNSSGSTTILRARVSIDLYLLHTTKDFSADTTAYLRELFAYIDKRPLPCKVQEYLYNYRNSYFVQLVAYLLEKGVLV